jgi:hypothetical protein
VDLATALPVSSHQPLPSLNLSQHRAKEITVGISKDISVLVELAFSCEILGFRSGADDVTFPVICGNTSNPGRSVTSRIFISLAIVSIKLAAKYLVI